VRSEGGAPANWTTCLALKLVAPLAGKIWIGHLVLDCVPLSVTWKEKL